MAFKIAAHAADIARGSLVLEIEMMRWLMRDASLIGRRNMLCALDPERARSIRESRAPEEGHSETCSMCGKFCAVRSMNKALNSEYIDIL